MSSGFSSGDMIGPKDMVDEGQLLGHVAIGCLDKRVPDGSMDMLNYSIGLRIVSQDMDVINVILLCKPV